VSLSAGSRFGAYDIVSLIGTGGMGEVYRARDARLNRDVAIKILSSEFTQDADRVRRFEQEALAASGLNHPNILTIYEAGEAEGQRFIATEFVDGETLRPLLARVGRLPVADALAIGAQVAAALTAAHAAGIVHRDIKPDNVMIRPDGYVKVLDFGVAKLLASSAANNDEATITDHRTQRGVIVGTLPYMSPEQARGTAVDARSDVWSLGCLLYEILAGRRPFTGATDTDMLIAIVEKEPPPLSQLAMRMPPECEWVIAKALRKNPAERYQTATDLLADLRRVQQNLVVDSHQSAVTSFAHPGSRRWSMMAIGAIAVASIAIAGFVATSRYRAVPPAAAEARSLAVLPLKSLSAADDHLGLGIADAVIRTTSQVSGLIVRPTSAVSRYATSDTDALTAARELSADAVLEGSVQRQGDRLRVSVNLLRVQDGASMWADSFDMRMTDIFTIQDTVAQQVAVHLRRKLDASPPKRGAGRPANPLAYEYFLKGMQLFDQRIGATPAQRALTIDLFSKAIELDPDFALAHAQLGYSLAIMAVFRQVPDEPGVAERARAEIERARAIDPDLPEIALARYQLLASRFEGFQFAEAVRVVLAAQRTDPTVGHGELGYLFAHMGLADLAERSLQRALEVDPTSAFARDLTLALYEWGSARYDKWLDAHERLEPTAPIDPWYLLGVGRLDDAGRALDRALAAAPNDIDMAAARPVLAALRGDARAAQAAIPALLARHPVKDPFYHHTAAAIAAVYAIDGKAAEAVKWLREADATGFAPYPMYDRSTYFDRIRRDPAFVQFMAELKAKIDGYRREFAPRVSADQVAVAAPLR
jgi:serine/threonine protein kinase